MVVGNAGPSSGFDEADLFFGEAVEGVDEGVDRVFGGVDLAVVPSNIADLCCLHAQCRGDLLEGGGSWFPLAGFDAADGAGIDAGDVALGDAALEAKAFDAAAEGGVALEFEVFAAALV